MDQRAAFDAAHEAVVAGWPVPPEPLDVATPHGTTRVLRCGPADGTPVLLLPGGGATGAVWGGVAAGLADAHRAHAVDLPGDVGRTTTGGRPPRRPEDLVTWYGALLDGLGLERAHLAGHSYGAWVALTVALALPHRVERLVLLDPTDVVAGLSARYLVRAVPVLVRPTPQRARALLRWETAGRALDPAFVELYARGAVMPSRVVRPRRPRADVLSASSVPTHVVLAGDSRAHDVRVVEERVRRSVPAATTTVVPGATHHTVPVEDVDALVAAVAPPG